MKKVMVMMAMAVVISACGSMESKDQMMMDDSQGMSSMESERMNKEESMMDKTMDDMKM